MSKRGGEKTKESGPLVPDEVQSPGESAAPMLDNLGSGEKIIRETTTTTKNVAYREPAPPALHYEDEDDESDRNAIDADLDEDLFTRPDIEEARPELSPLDRFLRNMAGTSDAVVYVIRKPDPATLAVRFRNPCNIRGAAGEIPFDENFTDRESIEMAVQSAFKGGSYMLQIRRGGEILKSWSTIILDPPNVQETTAAAAPPVPSPETPNPAPNSLRVHLAQIKENTKDLLELRELMNWNAPATTSQDKQLGPAEDPQITLLRSLQQDDPLRARIIERMFPVESEGGAGIVAEVMKNPDEALQLVTGVLQTVKDLFIPDRTPANGQRRQAPAQAPQPPQDAPADPEPPHVATFEQREEFINNVLAYVEANTPLDLGAAWFQAAARDIPDVVSAWMTKFKSMPPAVLRANISRENDIAEEVMKKKHALPWLENLQNSLTAATPPETENVQA